jgi:hypothetical protein
MRKDNKNLEIYSTIIEYKRSIGITQWTVLSIFVTASEAVFVFSLSLDDPLTGTLSRFFGAMIYWLGFLLYNRYRQLNHQVSKYLMELEKENGYEFQHYLDSHFHAKGLSTKNILIIAGVLYIVFALMISTKWF